MVENTIFYINDYQIDLSRSVLTKGEYQTQIEPKVLKVLLLLAQQPNEVVTHQTIKEQVWQGAEVVPGALQRCIAILRKALGDDAKSPTIIATHPKIGYRLLAQVRWQAQPVVQSASMVTAVAVKNKNAETNKFPKLPLISSVFLLSIVAILLWLYTQSEQGLPKDPNSLHTQYTQIKPLTQTDAHESHAVFSPSAKYLIFNRYAGSCKNHIWARHLETGEESQLTAQPGDFGAVSFTDDGRELVFAAKTHCGNTNNKQKFSTANQMCWSIATLDFSHALSAPSQPHFRYQCQADRLLTPKALPNHQYAFLQSEGGRYQLMQYDDLSKKLNPLYASETQYIYHFDYDPKHKRFAVISRDNNFNNMLILLDESGQVTSSKTIKLMPEMSRYQIFPGEFEPQGEYLLAVSNSRLYKIALNGQLQWVQTPTTNLISIAKHPSKRNLLAVQGKKDIDIARLNLTEKPSPKAKNSVLVESDLNPVEPDLNSITLPFSSLARSAAQERHALYQPKGDRVAFISDRSGNDQIWIWRNGKTSQLSFGTSQNKIQSYSWSPDGTHLAWTSGDKLLITDLNGDVQLFSPNKPIYSVLSWFKENHFLVLLSDPQPGGLYHLDLEQNKLTPYGVNHVEAAWVLQNKIIFSDTNGEVFSRSLENEKTDTKKLSNLNSRALFIADQLIYSVDKNSFMLNQYNLNGELLKPVTQLKATAWKVTGLMDEQLLLSQFIAINQDIMMLE